MQHVFETEQWLPYPVAQVFAFFADPANLPRLMPRWQRARIESLTLVPPPPPPPDARAAIAAGQGTRITLSFRPLPLSPMRLRWDAEIAEFTWHDRFCDIQRRGPFASWKHCHRIRPETRNNIAGTLLTDHVVYEPPFGPLGTLANALVLRFQIRSAFAFRHKRTPDLIPQTSDPRPQTP
ncbi:MAG: SRPBCC family protein [Acidobacteriota bacterium]|nr:SRPBCC family protein [Acidobacteriota bacterium]